MRDLCRSELGEEVIGALSFLWGSPVPENDVEANSKWVCEKCPIRMNCVFIRTLCRV